MVATAAIVIGLGAAAFLVSKRRKTPAAGGDQAVTAANPFRAAPGMAASAANPFVVGGAQPSQAVVTGSAAPGAATGIPNSVPLLDETGQQITYVKGSAGPSVLSYGTVSVNMQFDGQARPDQPLIQVDARGVVTVAGGFATHIMPGVGRISQGGDKGHEGVNIQADDALMVIYAQAYQAARGSDAQRKKVAQEAQKIAAQIKRALELGQDPQTLAALQDGEAQRRAEAARKEAERRRKAARKEAERRRKAAAQDDDDDDDDLTPEELEDLVETVEAAEAEAAGQGHRGDAALEEDLF